MRKFLSTILAAVIVVNVFYDDFVRISYKRTVKDNTKKYEQEIDLYNEFLKEYANYIKSLELSETEMIIKVIKDIWNDIDGYGKCDDLILGYERLAFQVEGKGVCLSFADDFTARINAINPGYDAKNIIVYMNELEQGKTKKVIDLERNFLEKSSNVDEDILKKKKEFGNHRVSVMELKDKNLYLVVDPTNLLIGVLRNGEIKILNTNDEKIMDYRFDSSTYLSLESMKELKADYKDTFEEPAISEKEINELYGFDAQEDALDKVNAIDANVKRLVKLNGDN